LPSPAFASCWDCSAKSCESELAACAADCDCSQALSKAITCENGTASLVPQCFGPMARWSAPVTTALAMCLFSAGANSGCSLGPIVPASSDASAVPASSDASACVGGGLGSGSGNGSCTSENSEACGGIQYKVVCACPEAICVCFGPSTKMVPFSGCPFCPHL